ncbi:DUF6350 family protein [Georgenia sp. Z1491]|uniref:cell division protein PerM n=1 Tax=Georgenia sp. Z1491 TaxID=3416707 RepID=UPI003CEA4414
MTATTTRPAATGTGRRLLLPEGWLRALVAALEAALLGWLVCVVPAIAAYVATAASPALGETTWQSALGVGSAAWLLGHGAPAGTLSLVPLGLSAVLAALVMATARRHVLVGATHVVVGVGYVVLVQGVSLLSPFDVDHLRLALGSALVAAAGGLWSWWRTGARTRDVIADDAAAAPSDRFGYRSLLVGVRALRGAAATLAVLVCLGLLASVAALALHADRVLALHESFDAGVVGATVLVLGQLAYLPTLGVWALSYIAGPGFAVGAGTSVAPGGVELGAVPGIPLLGALPESPSPLGAWPVLLVVVAGAVGAWWTSRPGHAHRLVDAVAGALGAALIVGSATLVAALASSGGIGSGRMADLGPDALVLAGLVTAGVALGALLTTVLLHPLVRAGIAGGVRSVRGRTGGTEGTDDADAGSGAATAGTSTKGPRSEKGPRGEKGAAATQGAASTTDSASAGAAGESVARSTGAGSGAGTTSTQSSSARSNRSRTSSTRTTSSTSATSTTRTTSSASAGRWSVTGSMASSSRSRGGRAHGAAASGSTR